MKCSISLLIQLVTTLHSVNSIQFVDCTSTYNKNTSHVEYICVGDYGSNFHRRDSTFLYCNNDSSGIIRGSLRILTYRGCEVTYLGNDIGLNYFPGLFTLNVFACGIETLDGEMFETNYQLENLIASQNKIASIPSNLFIYTQHLLTISFSDNRIVKLEPEIFVTVPKLKAIHLAQNRISEIQSQLFSNLFDLEFLDISNN